MNLHRRDWLAQMVALGLAGCRPAEAPLAGGWVGAAAQRGHRLRALKSGALPVAAVQRRTSLRGR